VKAPKKLRVVKASPDPDSSSYFLVSAGNIICGRKLNSNFNLEVELYAA